jgi:hypothetical protein
MVGRLAEFVRSKVGFAIIGGYAVGLSSDARDGEEGDAALRAIGHRRLLEPRRARTRMLARRDALHFSPCA